jgi:hypothetical protein
LAVRNPAAADTFVQFIQAIDGKLNSFLVFHLLGASEVP